jgi:hypothetical protein
MTFDLASPEERELRSLIYVRFQPDGSITSVITDPERYAELRRIIDQQEEEFDRRFLEEFVTVENPK